jgi:hypothetical protein
MLVNRRTLALFMAISCSTTPLAAVPQSVPGDSCSNINLVGVGCATFRFVGVERAKPFVAQRVVTSTSHGPDGIITKVEWTEFTARDTGGRIRFEQKDPFKAPDWRENGVMTNHDIEKIVLPAGSLGSLVTIFDCFKRKSIVLQPELAVAHVIQTCDSLPPEQWGNDPYSYLITRLLNLRTPPNVLVEDLGYREIGGITARGMRSTFVGTEKDGEWSGRPTGVVERWMSDELAATVLYIHSDLKTQVETVSSFTNIKKGAPGAALFEIPPGYKVILSQDTVESGVKEKPL